MSLGNKETMAKNIKRLMALNQVNATDVCTALGFKAPTFSDWVNAKTYPRIDKIEAMSNYFGVSKADLVEEQLPSDAISYAPTQRIPILGRISAGLPLYADEQIEGYTYTDLNHGGEYFALRVHGDSMDALGIKEGYLVIVRRQDYVDNGTICVVLVGDNEATMKRFYQDGDTVTLMPQSTNPKHMPQIYNLKYTPIHIIGKIVKVEFTLDLLVEQTNHTSHECVN